MNKPSKDSSLLSGSSIAPLGRELLLTKSREELVSNKYPELNNTFSKPKNMIDSTGRVIDAKHKWIIELDLEAYIEKSGILKSNQELLKSFIQDAKLGKTIKQGAKKKIDKPRLIKYVQDLKKLDKYFRKPLDTLTQQDMEQFILDLEEKRLIQSNGKPYSDETQVCIKKIIIKFYKWLNKGKKPDLVDWIDTSYKIKDYRAPREEQIHTILERMSSNQPEDLIRNRAALMVLFDSGIRADELNNVRLEHLIKEGTGYKIRITVSKTKPRTISLPLSTTYLEQWLKCHPNKHDVQAQLFPLTYTALHHMIQRAGKRAGMKLTPHSLRHAAATYWARHLSRYQLCQRMGWALSSKQPDRYIDQEGLGEEKVIQIVEQSNVQRLANENADLKRSIALLQEQMERFIKSDKEELKRIIQGVIQEDKHRN